MTSHIMLSHVVSSTLAFTSVYTFDEYKVTNPGAAVLLAILGMPLGVVLMCAGVKPGSGLRARGVEACSCGYSREGLGDAACPECGKACAWPGGAEL